MKIKKFKDLNEGFFTSKEFEKEFKKLVNNIIDNFNIYKLYYKLIENPDEKDAYFLRNRVGSYKEFTYKHTDLTTVYIKGTEQRSTNSKISVKLYNSKIGVEDITNIVNDKDIKKLFDFFEKRYNNKDIEIENIENIKKVKKVKQIFYNI